MDLDRGSEMSFVNCLSVLVEEAGSVEIPFVLSNNNKRSILSGR